MIVFCQTGQVARELARIAPPQTRFLGLDVVNLVLPGACTAAILAHRPSVVIYAAASAAVDHAEAVEPAAMARASAELGIPMVHISTDYVFDGQGIAPFASDAAVVLLNAYGRTKAADEGRSDPRQLRTARVPAH